MNVLQYECMHYIYIYIYTYIYIYINKQGLSCQHSQSAQCYQQSEYICDGYHQQQPIIITWCFIGFTQSSDDYTILFNLKKIK